jgi:hypothetical protein
MLSSSAQSRRQPRNQGDPREAPVFKFHIRCIGTFMAVRCSRKFMKIIKLFLTALAFFSCSVAQASYFEYCYLDGQVVAVSKAKKKSSKIEFLVSRSVASTLKEEHSYSPQVCANYIGKTIKIKFHTEQKAQYTVGEQLKIRQVVFDAITSDGMATLVSWEVIAP